MKKIFITTIASGVFLLSCNKDKNFQVLSRELKETVQHVQGEISGGNSLLKVTANNELMILQATNPKKPKEIDKIIIVAFEKNASIPIHDKNLEYTDLVFFSDKRSIALHSKVDNKIYLLGLDESESQHKIDLLKSNKNTKNALKEPLLGYGISVLTGSWNLDKLMNNKYHSAFNQLDYSSNIYSIVPPDDGGSGGSVNCTSGGPGASECSIGEWPSISCSVTCKSGYYACCDSKTTKCFCVKGE
jgi:hypothetical protein